MSARRNASPSSGNESKPKRQRVSAACTTCKQRKSKCDAKQPCSACINSDQAATCVYPAPTQRVEMAYLQDLEAKARRLEEYESRQTWPAAGPRDEYYQAPPARAIPRFNDPPRYNEQPAHAKPNFISPFGEQMQTSRIESNTRASSVQDENENEDGPDELTFLAAGPADAGTSSMHSLLGSIEAAAHHLASMNDGEFSPQSKLPPIKELGRRPSVQTGRDRNAHLFRHDRPTDLYFLPPKHIADELIEAYRVLIQPYFPVLHWPSFVQSYERTFRPNEPVDHYWLGLLNQVFAMGCQISIKNIMGGSAYENGVQFYQRSLTLMWPIVLASDSLYALQSLLLMGQYLQSAAQPRLCWVTVGNCIRFAQNQGLNLAATTESMDPIECETRRRAWACCVFLEAVTSATLGQPPSLTYEEAFAVPIVDTDDDFITRTQFHQAPSNYMSRRSFLPSSHSIYAIQLRTLKQMYSVSTSTATWPDAHAVLELERSCASLEASFPLFLRLDEQAAVMREDDPILIGQAVVLHLRLLGLRMLIHRPFLFHLCQRGTQPLSVGPSQFDLRIARQSAELCCNAAMQAIELIDQHWRSQCSGAWWFQLYYIYGASLCILAGLIIDGRSAFEHICDSARADRALADAQRYLTDISREDTAYNRLPSESAKLTAQKSSRNIGRIQQALSRATNSSASGNTPESHAAHGSHVNQQGGAPGDNLVNAFLQLVPNDRTSGGLPNGYAQHANTLMSEWTMQDLLTSNTLQFGNGQSDFPAANFNTQMASPDTRPWSAGSYWQI